MKLRYMSVLTGLGLSCVLLGGFTGVYLADGGLPGYGTGSSVAIRLIEDGAGSGATHDGATNNGGARIALGEVTRFELAVPAPDESPAVDRRAALGAALARLYEEPLETAVGPTPKTAGPPGAGALQQAALPVPPMPGVTTARRPAWRRFAVPVANLGTRPMIAVVLDDLGLNRAGTQRAIALPGPLTLSFMTYAEGLGRMAGQARAAGHELMLHVPMAPRDASYDPGPNVLGADLPDAELARRLDWGLERFDGFVGVNNHMGSRFTASPRGMAAVMGALRSRGLLFLDSVTSPASVGAAMARHAGVAYAERDIFLDNEWSDRAAIARQFERLEAVALRRGSAIGIGHPHRATLDVLARWLPEARARGFAIVPISAIVRHRLGIGRQYVETSG
ncbi:MAG: divergent polysaccharide deacetylase family protein [Proteobacteria bacterium]|nr:divergent polysaccharide deacetylase family protein [Pseudomonadota bacterium]